MTVMSRDNWAFGAQIVSAIGILVIRGCHLHQSIQQGIPG